MSSHPGQETAAFIVCLLVILTKGKSAIDPLERVKGYAMAAESQFQFPAGFDQPGSPVDQLLDNGPDSSALCRVTYGGAIPKQSKLTDKPQDVISKGGK